MTSLDLERMPLWHCRMGPARPKPYRLERDGVKKACYGWKKSRMDINKIKTTDLHYGSHTAKQRHASQEAVAILT